MHLATDFLDVFGGEKIAAQPTRQSPIIVRRFTIHSPIIAHRCTPHSPVIARFCMTHLPIIARCCRRVLSEAGEAGNGG